MKFYKEWWFWIAVIALIILIYWILGILEIIPTYHCGSTMDPDGPINWCGWHKGTIVG